MRAFLLLLFFPALALAQSSGSVNMDSVRAAFCASTSYSLTLQTESVNALTGKLAANPGQIAKVGTIDLIKQTFVLAEIPGPKTVGAKTLVASVKATWVVTGGVGWIADPIVVHVTPLAIELPAGQTLALRYDMPATACTSFAPGALSWLVGVGAKAADIPAPPAGPTSGGTITPAPTPAPTPTPTPVPAPAPPSGTSPDCAKLGAANPSDVLVDSAGAKYTAVVPAATGDAREIGLQRNGAQHFGAIRYAYIFKGQACVQDDLSPGDPIRTVSCYDAPSNTWPATGAAPACP